MPLAALDEVWTCYLEAEDISAPNDEAAQYVAARRLYERTGFRLRGRYQLMT